MGRWSLVAALRQSEPSHRRVADRRPGAAFRCRSALILTGCFLLFVVAPRLLVQSRLSVIASPDSPGYAAIAQGLGAGDFIDPRLGQLRLPGYPIFLAALDRVVGLNATSLSWTQLFCGILAAGCALIFLLRAGGAARAGLGVALFGLNPVFLLYEHWWMSESLFVLTCLVFLLTVVALRFAPMSFLGGLALGGSAAAVLLTRANGAALVAVGLAFVVLQHYRPARGAATELPRRPTHTGLLGCATALLLLLGAWAARNALTVGPPLYLAGGEQARLAYTVLMNVAGDADRSWRVLGPLYDPADPASIYRVLASLRRAHPASIEAEARSLRMALSEERTVRLLRARIQVLGGFFGATQHDSQMRNVANAFSHGWIEPSPEFFLRARRTAFWERYDNRVPERSRILSWIGQAGLRYLGGGRLLVYLVFALFAFVSLRRQHPPAALHVRITWLLVLAAIATAGLHAWTLAGIDRFAAAFDWIPILGIAHCVTSLPPRPENGA